MDLSVIVPFYNSERTIRDCILSILDSDFSGDFEIIAVDDGSTDRSIELIKDLDIKIIRQKNKGAASARNAGARASKSDLIIFVDSDVAFFKDTLQKIYDHLKKEGVHYVGGRYSRIPINQKWIHKYKALADYSYNYDFVFTKEQKGELLKQVSIACGMEGWKKEVFEKLGYFDENIKGADVEREKIFPALFCDYNMITDPNIVIMHNFPDFMKLVKNYFLRVFHSMDLVLKNNYDPPILKKNKIRCILGMLTMVSLFLSAMLFLIFKYTSPFVVTSILFLIYLLFHLQMFITAFKDYGIFFMLYALAMNLFFSSLITLAGFLGTVKNLARK